MAHIQNQSRAGRPPSGDVAKKVVSLTIDPALIEQVDAYAADKGISRSAAVEAAIVGLLALKTPNATSGNSLDSNILRRRRWGRRFFINPFLGEPGGLKKQKDSVELASHSTCGC